MILTVTPNPTIDRVLFVNSFDLPDVVRADSESVSPSGKGIDVSVVLHTFGIETIALGLNAGVSGHMLRSLMNDAGAPYDFVEADGYTRVAALITDTAARRQSTIIANTLLATQAHLDLLLDKAAAHMRDGWGMVCAGSLPPGMPSNAYARLITMAKQQNLTTLLDSSGDSLRKGVQARPDILKVNLSELVALAPEAAAIWQENAEQDSMLERAARLADFAAAGISEWAEQAIIVTLGRLGAVAVTPDGRWYAPALEVTYVSPAGAGDGMTSGVMLALYQNGSWKDALALGTATAANVVTHPGTCECAPGEVEQLLSDVELVAV